jgi:hypothetical protein
MALPIARKRSGDNCGNSYPRQGKAMNSLKRKQSRAKLHQMSESLRMRLAREKHLIQLAYRAQQIAIRKAHVSPGWMDHFQAKATRLFEQAILCWRGPV